MGSMFLSIIPKYAPTELSLKYSPVVCPDSSHFIFSGCISVEGEGVCVLGDIGEIVAVDSSGFLEHEATSRTVRKTEKLSLFMGQ